MYANEKLVQGTPIVYSYYHMEAKANWTLFSSQHFQIRSVHLHEHDLNSCSFIQTTEILFSMVQLTHLPMAAFLQTIFSNAFS